MRIPLICTTSDTDLDALEDYLNSYSIELAFVKSIAELPMNDRAENALRSAMDDINAPIHIEVNNVEITWDSKLGYKGIVSYVIYLGDSSADN